MMISRCRYLLALSGLLLPTAAQIVSRPEPVDGPLGTDYDIVATTAQAVLDAYTPSSAPTTLEARKDGVVKLAAVLFEDSIVDACIAVFRGPDSGFAWIGDADLDMSVSYMHVKDQKKKKCRVVKHYKTLYLNRRFDTTIKEQVDDFLDQCSNSRVVLAGHDLGGALATIGAVEYAAADNFYTFVFGAPPVFQPAQYKTAPLRLGKGPRKKHPCKHLHNANYYTFINSELVAGIGSKLVYDFMPYLSFLVYFSMDAADGADRAQCLVQAANTARAFFADPESRGNLGSNFGSRYLFSPADATVPNFVSYLPIDRHENRRKVSFGNQGINIILDEDLLVDGLLDPTSECGPGDTVPPIHRMETYLAKIEILGPNERTGFLQSQAGFPFASECNMDTDCESGSCTIGSGATAYACEAIGAARGQASPPRAFCQMKPNHSNCMISTPKNK